MKTSRKILLGLGGVALAVGSGVVIHRVVTRDPHRALGRLFNPGTGVKGVHAEGASVSPAILARLHPRIDAQAIADHVVHLTLAAQDSIYDAAQDVWDQPDVPAHKDAIVRRVLAQATRTTWPDRASLRDDDPRAQVWDGTAWLVELMGASAEEQTREARAGAAS